MLSFLFIYVVMILMLKFGIVGLLLITIGIVYFFTIKPVVKSPNQGVTYEVMKTSDVDHKEAVKDLTVSSYSFDDVKKYATSEKWNDNIIPYTADEIRQIILESENDFSVDNNTASTEEIRWIAENCARALENKIFAFPGFKYQEFVARIGKRNSPQEYPALKEGNFYLLIEGIGEKQDEAFGPFKSLNASDSYRFELEVDKNSCKEIENNLSGARSYTPLKIKELILGLVLTDKTVEQRLQKEKFYINVNASWSEDNSYSLPEDVPIKKEGTLIKSVFFRAAGDMIFTAYVDLRSGVVFVTELKKEIPMSIGL